MLTRRAFFGRLFGLAACAVAAPAVVAELAKAAPRGLSAYDLAKMEMFARLYGARARQVVVMTGRSVGKSTTLLANYQLMTGRFSSQFPNMTNIPKRDGEVFEVDFDAVEARVLACADERGLL